MKRLLILLALVLAIALGALLSPIAKNPAVLAQTNTFCAANLTCTVSAAWTFSSNLIATGTISCTTLSNVKCVDGVNLTLASALSGLTANTTLWITANASFPTSDQIITVNNVTIKCWNGAKITRTTANTLQVNGSNFLMDGCIWDGGSLATMKQGVVLTGNFQTVQNNVYQNYTGTGGSLGTGIIYLNGATNFNVSNNVLTNVSDQGIFGEKNTTHGVVSGNNVDNTTATGGGHAIAFHSTGGGQIVSDITITGNIMRSGGGGFCIEVSGVGGLSALDFTVAGNKCKLTAASQNGGYSIATASNFSVTGNVFDANGFSYATACIEVVIAVTDGTVAGNTCNDGTNGEGISIDRAIRTSITGNEINGFKTTATDFGIHVVVSSTTSPSASDNVIANNVIVFPAAGVGIGIWQQCQAVGATCINNTYSGNHILGTAGAGSTAIQLEHDSGTSSDAALITGNQIKNVTNGVVNGASVTNTLIGQNAFVTVTTPFSGAGAWLPVTQGAFNVNETGAPSGIAGFDACYGDSTLHALKCSYNNGTFFQIPQVITATSAAFATATTAGTCVQSTTAVAGAATTMSVLASPVSTPGVGSQWSAFVSSAGNVTINECAVATSAGGTIAFNIRVIP